MEKTESAGSQQGKCSICGKYVEFQSAAGTTLREAQCPLCRATRRNRDVALCLLNICLKRPASSLAESASLLSSYAIYEAQCLGPIHLHLRTLPGYVCSEYLDGIAPGSLNPSGIRCEDLENLSFQDESFDLVITQDVLEHVSEPDRAFREIHRVLKPFGWHIFTVPLHEGRPTLRRALKQDGKIVPLLPDVFHGDPVRGKGILVFTDFGEDLAAHLSAGLGIPTAIACYERFYSPHEIPYIDNQAEYEKYLPYAQRKEMLKYFFYNSVVFASVKLPPMHAAMPASDDARQLIDEGERLYGRGLIEEALLMFRRVTEEAPDNPDGWNNLGVALAGTGRIQEARLALMHAVELRCGGSSELANLRSLLMKKDHA